MSDSKPYSTHTRYDGVTEADPVAVQHEADLEQLVVTLRGLLARKGAITKAQIAAALTAAHQPTS